MKSIRSVLQAVGLNAFGYYLFEIILFIPKSLSRSLEMLDYLSSFFYDPSPVRSDYSFVPYFGLRLCTSVANDRFLLPEL